MSYNAFETLMDRAPDHPATMVPSQTRQHRQQAVGPMAHWRNRLSLASIAKAMDVPVVIATFRAENYVKTFATFGLDLANNLAPFAAVCDTLCGERAVVIPDARTNPAMAGLKRHWPSEDICFLAGIPLRNIDGRRVGSLCVMNNSRAVARSGISFRTLSDVGRAFAKTGQLQPISNET